MGKSFFKSFKELVLPLRPYQREASNNINHIYQSESDYNRFAGVVLPTGGGKSFVAIDQLIYFNNDQGQRSDLQNGIINNTKIAYVAPGKEIISQVRLHILKNVILNMMNLENMSIDEINKMMKKEYPRLRFKPITDLKDNSTVQEKQSAIIQNLSTDQIAQMVEKAFPNLTFKCYAGIKETDSPNEEVKGNAEKETYDKVAAKSKIKASDITEAELVIIDEAHRVGAKSWGEEIETAFSQNKDGRILAITATPERVDKKGKRDMMYKIAKMIYPNNVPLPEQYMAQEIYLLDAMRDGLVTPVEVVDFPSSLADSDEYWDLVDILDRFERDGRSGTEKNKVINALEKMDAIIGYSPRMLTEEEREIKRQEDLNQTLAQNLENKNGKYIAFIPKRNPKDGLTPEEHFAMWDAKIRAQFEGIIAPDLITIEYVSSEKTDAQNDEVLKRFEDAPNDRGGIKILVSIDKLDEGVHVDGIDGEFMYKKVNSSRLYLQESGRCISSCDPNLPSSKQTRRKIFDMVGNTRRQVQKQTGKQTSHKYNLKRIREISEWIKQNNQYPNINKQISEELPDIDKVVCEKEIRYAIALKSLKSKYQLYLGEEDLPYEDRATITEILSIAQEINLWDTKIPNRIYEPSEEELTGSEFLSYSEREKAFMEAYSSAEYAGNYKVLYNKHRFAKVINILKILKAHKPDLELPEGMLLVNKGKQLRTKTLRKTSKVDFLSFLEDNFSEAEISSILRELQDYDLLDASSPKELYSPGEEINLAEELAFARGYFWSSGNIYEDVENRSFSKISLKTLITLGLIDIHSQAQNNDLFEMFGIKLEEVLDKDGYIKSNYTYHERYETLAPGKFAVASKFKMASFKYQGSEYINGYNRYGYDREGFDKLGFDKFGYNREKIHRDTGTKYNIRGFYWDEKESKWLNRETNTEYDLLGYNIYDKNEEGFERPGVPPNVKALWYKRFDDGTYSEIGKEFSEITKENSFGFPKVVKKGPLTIGYFYRNGAKYDIENPRIDDYYINGNDINGYNPDGFKLVIVNGERKYIHRDTSMEFDRKGQTIDKNGNLILHPIFCNAQLILKQLIIENKSMDDIYSYLMQTKGFQDRTIAIEFVKRTLDTAVEFSKSAPEFDLYTYKDFRGKEINFFKGINKYPDKAAKVEEFFQICPIAKSYLIAETKEIKRRLDLPKGKESLSKRQDSISRTLKELDEVLEK